MNTPRIAAGRSPSVVLVKSKKGMLGDDRLCMVGGSGWRGGLHDIISGSEPWRKPHNLGFTGLYCLLAINPTSQFNVLILLNPGC